MAQETVEQSLDERLTVLKELQQKNSLGSEFIFACQGLAVLLLWSVGTVGDSENPKKSQHTSCGQIQKGQHESD